MALPEVKIQLTAGGIESVMDSLDSLEKKLNKIKKLSTTAVSFAPNSSSSSSKNGLKAEEANLKARERNLKAFTAGKVKIWKQEEAEAQRHFKKLESLTKSSVSKVNSFIGSSISKLMSLTSTALTIGGGFTIADTFQKKLGNEVSAKQLELNSGGKITSKQVTDQTNALASSFAVSQSQGIAGYNSFIAKGGTEGAKVIADIAPTLAKLANSSGADFNELAGTAGDIFAKDKTLSADQINDVMKSLVSQGREASVEMKDLAEYSSRITSASAGQGGDLIKNIKENAALAQLARSKGNAASAAEATESVKDVSADVHKSKANKLFAQYGIKTTDKDGRDLSYANIIGDSVSATHGNKDILQKMWGESSMKVVGGYTNTFLEEKAKQKANGASDKDAETAGRKAADKFIDDLTQQQISDAKLNEENAKIMETNSKRLEKAFLDLGLQVEAHLFPAFTKLIPVLEQALPYIGRMLEGFVSLSEFLVANPIIAAFGGLAATVVGVTGSIASVFGAEAMALLLTSSLGAGFGLALAAGLTPLIAAAIAIALGKKKGNEIDEQEKEKAIRKEKEYQDEKARLEDQRDNAISPDVQKGIQEKLERLVTDHDQRIEKAKKMNTQRGAEEVIIGTEQERQAIYGAPGQALNYLTNGKININTSNIPTVVIPGQAPIGAKDRELAAADSYRQKAAAEAQINAANEAADSLINFKKKVDDAASKIPNLKTNPNTQ